MTEIRMLTHMTGTRYDNQEWPGINMPINVPTWEAEHLVKAGLAEYPDAPLLNRGYDVLKVADPNYESRLKLADGGIVQQEDDGSDSVPPMLDNSTILSDSFDDDFDSVDEEEITPQVKRPSVVDNKEAWIEYAISKGASRETAAAKTKKQLAADY